MTKRQKQVAALIATFVIAIFPRLVPGALPKQWSPYLWLLWLPFTIYLVIFVLEWFVARSSSAAPPRSWGADLMQPDNDARRGELIAHSFYEALTAKQRRLEMLEVQAARKGHNIEPEISIEIEDLRREIEQLKQQQG